MLGGAAVTAAITAWAAAAGAQEAAPDRIGRTVRELSTHGSRIAGYSGDRYAAEVPAAEVPAAEVGPGAGGGSSRDRS